MTQKSILRRSAQILVLTLSAVAALGAGDASARFDQDGHKLMCACGCNELLGECNHVGCPDSEAMRNQLTASIAGGESDNQIFHDFQQKYGPVVLAEPMFTPFNHMAWVAPPLVLLLGIGGTLFLARKWKTAGAPAPDHLDPREQALRQRIRRETEL